MPFLSVFNISMKIFRYCGVCEHFPITKQDQRREAKTVVTFPQHGILNMKGQLSLWGRVVVESCMEQTQTKYCNIYQASPSGFLQRSLECERKKEKKKRVRETDFSSVSCLLSNLRSALSIAVQYTGYFHKPLIMLPLFCMPVLTSVPLSESEIL